MGLLEVLMAKTNSMYISDLTKPHMRPVIQRALRHIQAVDFSVQEWDDAVEYIAKQHRRFDSCEQARAFLLTYDGQDTTN